MDFELSPEQVAIRDAARAFADREIQPYVAEYDRDERFPTEIVRRAAKLGFTGGVVPPEYGGSGLDYLSFVLVIEQLAYHDEAVAIACAAPSGLTGAAVLRYGTEAQKQRYLAPLARGETFAGAGVTEPHSGTDVASMETTYRRDGSDYVINGAKIWISWPPEATWILTFATSDPKLKSRGITAFLIERSSPGLTYTPFTNKLGLRPLTTGELVLDGVRVPAENLLGEEGRGMRAAMCAVENGRLSVAARAVGVAQACLDLSVAYARERVVFDQAIGRYQLVQSMITDMVVGVEAARLFTYRLAWRRDSGVEQSQAEASIAKMFATDVAFQAATHAVQVHGAYGVSDKLPVARHLRNAKISQIVEGTNQIHRVLVAEHALGFRK